MSPAKPPATSGDEALKRMADLTRRIVAVPKSEVVKAKPKKRTTRTTR